MLFKEVAMGMVGIRMNKLTKNHFFAVQKIKKMPKALAFNYRHSYSV